MYPKKKPKTDRERFYDAFGKKVGCTPEQYLRRKLAGGMPEAELKRLYDMLAIERHVRRASTHEVPTCARCRSRIVLRTGQSGARKGQKFWGCSNYPACRYTKNLEEDA